MSDTAENVPKGDIVLPASTVLMLRDGANGLEVFMVVRHHAVDFASGALVFPGGKLDPADTDPAIRSRITGAEGAKELSDEELGFRVSAIREAFEESGVLLCRPRGSDDFVDQTHLDALSATYRKALEQHEVTMAEMLEREDLILAEDALIHFAHWITPKKIFPKRFDTHFFIVAAPAGHLALHDGREAVDSLWTTPGGAIAEYKAGQKNVVFATRLNLSKLGRSDTVAGALAAAAADTIVTVLPELGETDDGPVLRIPMEAGYNVHEVPLHEVSPGLKKKE
jgi:8-oxo-dGTP pyrophosphatase MutT (NUDIX family)